MKLIWRIRLSTLLLATIVLGLLLGLSLQVSEESALHAQISQYRQRTMEAIFDVLDQPLALAYVDGAPLEVVLKETRRRSMGQATLKTGVPIYVDPIGLQEAEVSMASPVKRPPLAERLTLGEHLKRALDPLGLGYVVKDGFLMITSKDLLDLETGDAIDPYLRFRDVLR